MVKNKKEIVDTNVNKILKSKDLWNKIIKELDKKIAGENDAKEIIALCCLGTLVENCAYSSFNLLTHAKSSTGKDYTSDNVLKLFPEQQIFKRTRISSKVLTYWKPTETWDGCILYLTDISEEIMNSEVLKVMCSEGSHSAILNPKTFKVEDIKIEGKPVIISTTANTTLNQEMLNRFSIINLTETQEQTRKVLEVQGRYAKEGISPDYDDDLKDAILVLGRHKVKVPFADKIALVFPSELVGERRNFNRFIDYIRAITCLYQHQRKKDKDGYLIAEYFDYEIARRIYMNIKRGITSLPFNQRDKNIIDILLKEKDGLLLTEIASRMNNPISYQAIKKHITKLKELEILQNNERTDAFNNLRTYYTISDKYFKIKPVKLPTSKELQVIIDEK